MTDAATRPSAAVPDMPVGKPVGTQGDYLGSDAQGRDFTLIGGSVYVHHGRALSYVCRLAGFNRLRVKRPACRAPRRVRKTSATGGTPQP